MTKITAFAFVPAAFAPAFAIAVAASTLIATPASAHGYDGWGQDRWAQSGGGICSGQQARALEFTLGRAVRQGDIAPRTAARMHDKIDRLEDRTAEECRERDWRAVERISYQYRDISEWIQREALDGRGRRNDYYGYRYDGGYGADRERWHQR